MSTKTKKSGPKGKRYTPAEKQAVVDYVNQMNARNGRGGQAAAAKHFGVSVLTVSTWLKAAGAVKAPAATKVAKAVQTAKPVKAPVVAKVAKPVVKKSKKKVPQGTRYTDEQKKTVLDFVAAVNAKNGRGGMSEAAKKFKITPLTVATWVRKFGSAGGTVTKAAPAAGVSPKVVAKLQSQVAKAEATLAKVKALLASI